MVEDDILFKRENKPACVILTLLNISSILGVCRLSEDGGKEIRILCKLGYYMPTI